MMMMMVLFMASRAVSYKLEGEGERTRGDVVFSLSFILFFLPIIEPLLLLLRSLTPAHARAYCQPEETNIINGTRRTKRKGSRCHINEKEWQDKENAVYISKTNREQ